MQIKYSCSEYISTFVCSTEFPCVSVPGRVNFVVRLHLPGAVGYIRVFWSGQKWIWGSSWNGGRRSSSRTGEHNKRSECGNGTCSWSYLTAVSSTLTVCDAADASSPSETNVCHSLSTEVHAVYFLSDYISGDVNCFSFLLIIVLYYPWMTHLTGNTSW